jgi:hypothetical protein
MTLFVHCFYVGIGVDHQLHLIYHKIGYPIHSTKVNSFNFRNKGAYDLLIDSFDIHLGIDSMAVSLFPYLIEIFYLD